MIIISVDTVAIVIVVMIVGRCYNLLTNIKFNEYLQYYITIVVVNKL